MINQLPWDVLCDGIQIVMCAVILIGVAWQRREFRRRLAKGHATLPPGGFSQEVLWQSLRQETGLALEAISAAVAAERAKLEPLLAAAPRLSAASGPAEYVRFRLSREDQPAERPQERSAHDDINNLAARGFSPRQIAAQTRRPLGEVELALRLQRAGV